MKHTVNAPKPYLSLFHHAYMESDDKKFMIRHFISSNQKNSYKQILDSNKYNDERYRMNPVVLYMHGDLGFFGQRSLKDDIKLNIAKNDKVFVETQGEINFLGAETIFDKESEEAMDLYRLYAGKFMNAWSKYWFPINKVLYDDEQDAYLAGSWGQYEYSSVKVGADGFAVGSDTYENAMQLVKSPMIKNSLLNSAIDNTIMNDFGISKNSTDIDTLINEHLKNFTPAMTKNEIKIEMANIFKNYTNELIPKLKEIASTQNKLVDLMQKNKTDIGAIAEEKCMNVFRQLMGKAS